ncbi:hypothetical protein KGD83_17515 [Nocardiopsis akebiae]|uniref:Condensation domain-containing protein n=1 Tax=Nocardiopsis akebiae TaxID=2831968 RepID=A0ABX8BYB9_9ACTN|nr:hypothetical protein [Nocardiopsis akebiae]QUX27136.1 hypothetical protein KGD83_17515 [Nocardiopsis akebiae]
MTAANRGRILRPLGAFERTRPIPPVSGPLARAVLVPGEPGSSAVVLTFAHQIADGVGGLRALLDLAAALGGEDLERGGLPGTQEELLARTGQEAGGGEAAAGGEAAEGGGAANGTPPERGRAHGRRRRTRAVLRARAARRRPRTARGADRAARPPLPPGGASVHAALCAAAATVLNREGREFVRVLSPMDLRRAVGLPDEVAVRFAGARTASTADEAKDFWALARRTGGSLARLRAPGALRAGAAAVAEHPPEGSGDAEAMRAAAAADIRITDLGVVGVAGGAGVAGSRTRAGRAWRPSPPCGVPRRPHGRGASTCWASSPRAGGCG